MYYKKLKSNRTANYKLSQYKREDMVGGHEDSEDLEDAPNQLLKSFVAIA
jgi:hypothetical protein